MNYLSFANSLLMSSTEELANVPAPLGFDSWITFWLIMFISVANAVLLAFVSYKFFQVLQLSGYKLKGLFAWMKENKGSDWGRLVILSFLSCAALLITNVLLEDFLVYKIMTYLGLIFYAIFTVVYIINVFSVSKKTPLRYTKRMKRMIGIFAILVFVVTYVLLRVSVLNIPYFTHGIIGLTPMLVPVLVVIAFLITLPFETLNNKSFIRRAVKKLSAHENLIKIGVTGSFGKTSVKNILTVMLSSKYKVLSSPYSYNTPLGLSKTILEDLKPSTQVFIAEMGARYVGDIKELANMIKPQMGIITGIGNQHLGTFITQENLKNTKFELADYVWANKGKMFFSADNENLMAALENRQDCGDSIVAGVNGEILKADNISFNASGSTFDIVYKNSRLACKTTLLGRHNISNILLCASVALSLGVSIEEIQESILALAPTAHRLALVPSSSSLTVIDDAYNGSVEGAKAALEVISSFPQKKFVITPGLIELGDQQFNSNFEMGIEMAKVCDYVIITGITNYEAISAGLEFGGFDTTKILRAGSVSQAVEFVSTFASPGDVCLFENDLPDNYA